MSSRNHNARTRHKGRSPSSRHSKASKMSKTSHERNGNVNGNSTPNASSRKKRSSHHHHHSKRKEHSHSDSSKYSQNKTKRHSSKNHKSSHSKTKSRHKSKSKSKHKSSSRRKRAYQYKSLREIIENITTKSSHFPSTNTAKETLITYYQTFTTAQELMNELENRFFCVLPVEEEDKSTRPYISDTDSVSERHFKFKPDDNGNNNEMDENKAYCIQVRVINLLTFWMKEYFMADFVHEPNMIDRLKEFIHRIKSLKTKQKIPALPSIPLADITDDYHQNPNPSTKPTGLLLQPTISSDLIDSNNQHKYNKNTSITTSDAATIPDPSIYGQIINKNRDADIIIRTTPKIYYDNVSAVPSASASASRWRNKMTKITSHHMHQRVQQQQQHHRQQRKNKKQNAESKPFVVSSNPLHPAHSPTNKKPANYARNTENEDLNTMCTESFEQMAKNISPMPPIMQPPQITEEPEFEINGYRQDEKRNDIIHISSDNVVSLSPNALYEDINLFHYDYRGNNNNNHNVDDYGTCIIITGGAHRRNERQKIMIRNINDYNNMHHRMTKTSNNNNNNDEKEKEKNHPLQLHEKEVHTKYTPKVFNKINSKTSDSSEQIKNNEIRDNINVSTPKTSSDDPHQESLASLKNDDSKISDIQSFDGNLLTPPNNNIVTPSFDISTPSYYVRDPVKYRNLADKIEKVLFKQQKEGRINTYYIQENSQRRLDRGGSFRSKQPNLIRAMFHSEIISLKEDFQNFKVKNDDIAAQITLMTFKAFKRVRKREFIDQAWKCKDRLDLAGNLCQLIDHFNCVSRWVQITILHCKDVKKRGRMIKKFIKIMEILLELNNFQSLCAIYGAITSSPIYSLEAAWSYVPDKHKHRFEEIKYYFITANNMQNLRALHKERHPPMIPYTGIYLQDLIQTEERFREKVLREQMKDNVSLNFTGSGGVVFEHLTKISKQIDNILIYAKTPYDAIKENHVLQEYLLSEFRDNERYTDDEIYKISENVAKADG